NTFGYRTKALEYQMLQNTSNPVVGYSGGWAQVIDFIPTFGLVFTGALILLGLSPVFSEEYSTGMASIILSSKHGKGKVITAKILAACIYIAGLVLFFALLNTATCFLLLGTNGGGYPLQNIYLYHASPYALTLARYFIYEILVFLAGSLAFGLLILFLSSLSRSALIPLFAGGLVFATPLALLKLGINIAWLNRLCELSYSEVMRVKNLFISFKVYDFFGRPVLYLDVVLLAVVVYSMVSVGLTYYTFKRHQVS
ncbi:MAG: ABC transporter permease, partial [Firmicutes bacterium]|nr:ABC transporter permease [Bacillota bacterium]